jgi:hypothetical protein
MIASAPQLGYITVMETRAQYPRTDRLTAAKVEKGLYVQRTSTTRAAANYMADHGVPFQVALRVLTTSYKRDMSELLRSPPTWHDIIKSSGPAYGMQLSML